MARRTRPNVFFTAFTRCIAGALTLLTLLVPLAASAQRRLGGDAFPLVAQALRARLRLTYLARQDILWSGPSGGVTQIVVDIARAGRRTRIAYCFPSETAGRVLVDDGTHGYLYDPKRRELLVGQSMTDDETAAAPITLTLLRHNFRCLRLRREILNGQACDVVAIRPRLGDGAAKFCWIDAAHQAILRTEEYDEQGCRRYVSSYENIHFVPHLPDAALSLPPASGKAAIRRVSVQTMDAGDSTRAFSLAGLGGRLPAWCPRGYALLHCGVISPRPGLKAVILHYCNGLKTLTVLEEPRGGAQPTGAELNGSLARYGQQAWVRDDGPLRIVVRGDLSLPSQVGEEMRTALGPRAADALSRGLARDFGPQAALRGAWLRSCGWGYEQIGALCLWQRSHPRLASRLKPLLTHPHAWPDLAGVFGVDADDWDARARAWVAATLARP